MSVADVAQKSVSLLLFGLTLYGTAVLAKGGYGVVQRHKQRKHPEANEGTTPTVAGTQEQKVKSTESK